MVCFLHKVLINLFKKLIPAPILFTKTVNSILYLHSDEYISSPINTVKWPLLLVTSHLAYVGGHKESLSRTCSLTLWIKFQLTTEIHQPPDKKIFVPAHSNLRRDTYKNSNIVKNKEMCPSCCLSISFKSHLIRFQVCMHKNNKAKLVHYIHFKYVNFSTHVLSYAYFDHL